MRTYVRARVRLHGHRTRPPATVGSPRAAPRNGPAGRRHSVLSVVSHALPARPLHGAAGPVGSRTGQPSGAKCVRTPPANPLLPVASGYAAASRRDTRRTALAGLPAVP